MNFKLISNFFLTTFPTNMCLACLFSGRKKQEELPPLRELTIMAQIAHQSRTSSVRLKFPVFEIINMAMTFTAFSPGMST